MNHTDDEDTHLDAWIDAHFEEEVRFLQALVRVPTDTPPGDNAPHAEATAALLEGFGFDVERHPVPEDLVRAQGMASITNLVVRRRFGAGPIGRILVTCKPPAADDLIGADRCRHVRRHGLRRRHRWRG